MDCEITTEVMDFPKIAKPPFSLSESFQNSPRRSHLIKAAGDTLFQSRYFGSFRQDDVDHYNKLLTLPKMMTSLRLHHPKNLWPSQFQSFYKLLVPTQPLRFPPFPLRSANHSLLISPSLSSCQVTPFGCKATLPTGCTSLKLDACAPPTPIMIQQT